MTHFTEGIKNMQQKDDDDGGSEPEDVSFAKSKQETSESLQKIRDQVNKLNKTNEKELF